MKNQLLELLETNKDAYVSGERIAEALGISRTAVWKWIEALRGEGYEIAAVRNKGYCLSGRSDILSVPGIQKYLKDPGFVTSETSAGKSGNLNINVERSVTSTNTLVRERAIAGEAEGFVLLADNQTSGKGRAGRSFFSPLDTGVYLSILLRPKQWTALQAARITTMAAVAACEAIEELTTDVKAQIKWVNDIFINGKKVSGILTEAGFGLEDGFLEYAVMGIGFNLYPPIGGFPEEIAETATSILTGHLDDGKNRLAARMLDRFFYYYEAEKAGNTHLYVDAYRKRCLVLGKRIEVMSIDGVREATALDIDRECHLIVEYDDGRRETLSTGEIRVRLHT